MSSAAETIARVQANLEDPKSRFFVLDDYVRAYNDALDEISEVCEINESFVFVKRRKWAVYTDLRGAMPPTFLRVTSVWNPNSAKWLDPITVRELDETVGRFWEKRSDQTRWWFMRGLWFLGAYPTAANDMMPLKIYYSSLLPHVKAEGGLVTGLTSTPNLPSDFQEAIENYMMYELLAERKEVDKSLQFYERFMAQIPLIRNLGENRMRRDRVPTMGARR